jgi:hypothetical protein
MYLFIHVERKEADKPLESEKRGVIPKFFHEIVQL